MSSALIVIDVQQGFDDAHYWGPRNNPSCESNIGLLIGHWRREGWPIVYVQHDSLDPDLLVRKTVNSAFHGSPDLDSWLRASDIDSIVICGITTNHCCETTARVGGNLGYAVQFVLDATHTFDRIGPYWDEVTAEELARITGVNLHDEFAQVVKTRELVGGGFDGVVL